MSKEHDHDVIVQNKAWSPKMVRLTSIGNREIANGAPQPVYIDPYCITLVVRGIGSWNVADGNPKNESIECTTVWLRGGEPTSILVVESPKEVALLRDRALEVPVALVEVK